MTPLQQAVLPSVIAAFAVNLEAVLSRLLVRALGQFAWVMPELLRTKRMPLQALRGVLSLACWGRRGCVSGSARCGWPRPRPSHPSAMSG